MSTLGRLFDFDWRCEILRVAQNDILLNILISIHGVFEHEWAESKLNPKGAISPYFAFLRSKSIGRNQKMPHPFA